MDVTCHLCLSSLPGVKLIEVNGILGCEEADEVPREVLKVGNRQIDLLRSALYLDFVHRVKDPDCRDRTQSSN